jgi:hypothetical protein
MTVLIHSLRRSQKSLAAVLLGASALFLQACGGGGTSDNTGLQVGALAIQPATGTLYAGVPFDITIAGGVRPYNITSNEQTVFPVNLQLNANNFTVVPNNPGVVDPQTDPNVVPSRSVTMTVRDNAGATATATYNVLQNFMTGYSISLNSISTCGSTSATATISACAGFETRIDVRPTSAGLLRAQRQLRFSVLYGPLGYIQDNNTTVASTYLLTTDSSGVGTARLFPTAGSLTQYAAIRVTDVATSAYRDIVFTLLSAPTGPLAAIPAALPNVVGANTTQCGFGNGSLVITGGTPPYTLTTTNASIIVSPTTVTSTGGSTNVTYGGGVAPNCASGQVVIRDSVGTIVSVDAPSSVGTTAPAVPLSVSPTSFCFTAGGQTGTAQVLGGNSAKVINSSNSAIATPGAATGTGNFALTITTPVASPVGTAIITINDGAAAVTVNITRAAVCP